MCLAPLTSQTEVVWSSELNATWRVIRSFSRINRFAIARYIIVVPTATTISVAGAVQCATATRWTLQFTFSVVGHLAARNPIFSRNPLYHNSQQSYTMEYNRAMSFWNISHHILVALLYELLQTHYTVYNGFFVILKAFLSDINWLR